MLPSFASVTRFSGRRQVLGRQPEVDGVLGDLVERERRRELRLERLLAAEHRRRRLADHLDVAHRVLEVLGSEVEVVDAQRLLELRRVRLLGHRQHRGAVVEHVVAAHLVGPVGESVGVAVIGRRQQQLGRVGGARRRRRRCRRGTSRSRRRARPRPRSRWYPAASVVSLVTVAFVSSVTFGCLRAGRTPKISASDLACTSDGNPSHVAQRMHGLFGMSPSSSRTPHGAWNG